MPDILVIVNPAAGQGAAARRVPEIQRHLTELKQDFEIVYSQRVGHAIELSRQAAGDQYRVVAAAGGDGTVNEVINGLLLAKTIDGRDHAALGVLPVGRGNDFSFGMGVPALLTEACQVLANGRRRWIDIGRVTGGNFPNGRYFGNGVGLGFDTVVGFEAARLRIGGMMAYLVAALKTTYLYSKAPVYRVIADTFELCEPFLMISIMNGRRMGGTFMMAPDSRSDDGLFDLCMVGQVSRPGILALIPRFIKGNQASHPAVKTRRACRLEVTAVGGTIPAHADGETVCEKGDKIALEILPHQLELLCSAA